jgi:hypothetical protein
MVYDPSMTDPIAPETPPDVGGKTRPDLSERPQELTAQNELLRVGQ